MKRLLSSCLASSLLSVSVISTALAQPAATTPAPAARPAPVISPEVNPDHSVIFRIKAPKATEVSVRGQWAKEALPMVKGNDGVWSGSAGIVPAGVWEYSIVVDGVNMIDPGNPALKPMREPRSSILHIAGSPAQVWDFQDVPHGTVHQHSYLSKVLNRSRELWVYTPPGYESKTSGKLPLLVLQHGSGDNQQTWVAHGKANWILDNLVAAGKARPMVVVMLDGHPLGRSVSQDPVKRAEATEAFRRELFEDALPLVEHSYRVKKDASDRAIVGLSMGGGQSLNVGLGNLDRFSWVGSFSGVAPADIVSNKLQADVRGTNAKLRLLWIGCGKDDSLKARNEEFVTKLKAAGIEHQWHLTEGGHTWPVWRGYLADFLPLLFQSKK
ncbi:MAG TPA: alpha/beta hydrolase-fold protein [Roseimicrobium sp.]|nr:alpha/beta hydrolase-fold protein [Roseimicrobium sp.]